MIIFLSIKILEICVFLSENFLKMWILYKIYQVLYEILGEICEYYGLCLKI